MPTKAETAETEAAELQSNLAALRAEIASLAKIVSETAENAENRAKATLKSLAVAGAEPLGEAKEKIDAWMGDAKGYAERKPVQALGIAAGVGVLIGLILARR